MRYDVQEEPIGVESFDSAFSRFGVMFFPEPDRAFAHIRQSLVDGGRFGFVCFQRPARRAIEQNPGIALGFAAASQPDRAAAVAAATETMSRHIVAGRVVMGAATWAVTAHVS